MHGRPSVLATRLQLQSPSPDALLSKGNKQHWPSAVTILPGRTGMEFLRPEKRKLTGTSAAVVRWSTSVWIRTTKLLSHILKCGLGSGRRQQDRERKSTGLDDLERSLPEPGHRPVVWKAESSYPSILCSQIVSFSFHAAVLLEFRQ